MRAKIKALNDFPSHLLCCEQSCEVSAAVVGVIIEVGGAAQPMLAQCDACWSSFKEPHYAVVGQEYQWVPVSAVDLDEGEV